MFVSMFGVGVRYYFFQGGGGVNVVTFCSECVCVCGGGGGG